MTDGLSEAVGRWVGRPVTVVALVVPLLSSAVLLQLVKGRDVPSSLGPQQLYLPSGVALDRMALSFDSVVADLYWIRALQHFGGTRRADQAEKNYDLLYPLLDIATTLDPRFNIAYRFGAIFLTEAYPDGPGRPDQAVALLQKGAEQMPERWEYPMDTGFVYYWWLHDYAEAARWFQRAGDIPGSPWWLQSLAANTLAMGGNRSDSRSLWRHIHDTADDEWLRAEAQRRLLQLDALDDIDRLGLEARQFAADTGRWPGSWEALVETGRLPAPPLDPLGHSYVLNQTTRSIGVSPQSPLSPLPDEPPSVMTP